MATIDIRRAHSLTLDEARKRAEVLAKDLASIGIRWHWEGDRIRFDAPNGAAMGVTGSVHVDPREIRVEADLPFLLKIIKGSIEGKINMNLDKALR